MELQFQKNRCRHLRTVVHEVQNQELTQELKLSDAMPDIGRCIGAWGQVILRGKEWRGDSAACSGGVMVWVLYAPEDGGSPRTLDTWIPFQMKWGLPDGTQDGSIRMEGRLRFLDARSVSPRKIMLRAGIGALLEALEPQEADVYIPSELPEDVELLRNTYPVRLPREAGEKSFHLDEELTLPPMTPAPDKLVSYSLTPRLTEKKILGGRVVFRGSGDLHVLYVSEEGQLQSWDFELPFSQFGELAEDLGPDAQVDITMGVTDLDLVLEPEGHFRLKCGMVAQYLVDDRSVLELVEDAYSPRRVVEPEQRVLEIPVLLDSRSENIYGEQTLSADVSRLVDTLFLPDYPIQRRTEDGIRMEIPGQIQILYYASDGSLCSAQARWEGSCGLPAHENCRVYANVQPIGGSRATAEENGITVQRELRMDHRTVGTDGIPMVSGLEVGEIREADASRPSVILRRMGSGRLWDIAKASGSTVDAIRSANAITEEASEDRMLLIPVL